MDTKQGDYLFIGTVLGIFLVLVIGWSIKSTEPPPTFSECILACESEGWNKTESWVKECEGACLERYKIKSDKE